jgi:hypothetical protein
LTYCRFTTSLPEKFILQSLSLMICAVFRQEIAP